MRNIEAKRIMIQQKCNPQHKNEKKKKKNQQKHNAQYIRK
jgi:hypothetical protein